MAVYKEEKTNTWKVYYRYTDWKGERKQTTKRGFATKREALAWEREQLNKTQADLDMTFASFVETYTADMKSRIKENTWHTKDHILRTKILPYFGKRKICEIQAKDIIAWQNEMLKGKDKNGKPYSPVYLKTLHNQLSAVFNHAVKYYGLHADQVLPPPDVLESAKSYREKKAMPLYRKIIGVLRNLFDKYLTLKHDYEDLQRKYERELDSGNQMKKTIKRLNEEKDSQSGIVAKFYALCRGFGEEYIESQAMGILEREAMERQQKKLARKRHDRDAR